MEIPSKGAFYTWTNGRTSQEVVWEKLDRYLANSAWNNCFPNSIVEVLPISASDHAPIILNMHPTTHRGKRQFKFELIWLHFKERNHIIEQAWDKQYSGSQAFKVVQKLKATAADLIHWNRTRVGNIRQCIVDTEAHLMHVQQNITNTLNFLQEYQIRKQLDFYRKCDHTMWAQREKQLWLKDGDRNTRYFHAMVNLRRKKNKIHGIMSMEGNWVTLPEDIKTTTEHYFVQLYQNEAVQERHLLKQYISTANPMKLSDEHLTGLNQVITKLEIENAVFQMEGDKTAGLDDIDSCTTVASIWRDFDSYSGLTMNLDKTEIKFSPNTPQRFQKLLSETLHCRVTDKFSKYLGAKIDSSARDKVQFQTIYSTLQEKLQSWKGKLLSRAGRLTLIKSVLTSMYLYHLNYYKLTKTEAMKCDSILAHFFWGSDRQRAKPHMINWAAICKPMNLGGLRVKSFSEFNQALLAK
ncbi:uncharacterized protein G2W53_037245 [Senna tora]|uniref:Reverse transcriptase n=1 Tax=Senna tora TaxID=362788 RepID=A0A834W5W8_9FABA|nr:uncharacterized protein G2W53_037245 [Senna tora]